MLAKRILTMGTDKFNLGTGLGLGVAMPLFHCSHNFYHMNPFPSASLSLAYGIGAWELGTVIYYSLTLKIYIVPLIIQCKGVTGHTHYFMAYKQCDFVMSWACEVTSYVTSMHYSNLRIITVKCLSPSACSHCIW